MNEATIIFPTQLFKFSSVLKKDRIIFLVEEKRYFSDFKFHKHKLILHRASMRYYFDYLKKQGYNVEYIDFKEDWELHLKNKNIEKLYILDTVDNVLKEKINSFNKHITWENSPCFLTEEKEIISFFKDKTHFSQTSFYIHQRKKLKILLDKSGKPKGGKWSYDKENREKLPCDINIPTLPIFKENKYKREAKEYVEKNFTNNYGDCINFIYPTTHDEVESWFDSFLQERLFLFGTYEDAIDKENSFLFHSVLSYALNIGLLTPKEVIEKTISISKEKTIPLNSLEGFIRQLIGWREFIRGIYLLCGNEMIETNFFNHNNIISPKLYTAKTEILPVDNVIQKTIKTGFANHIERLMIMGNFFLLCQISPKEVYRWFMELYIDSYDWVMIPNIFGMSQYADGGKMVTKPYLCSSNYILKMSNFEKGEWCNILNSLYWNFIYKNQKIFLENPRLKIMALYINNINKDSLKTHIKTAENYISKLIQDD